MLSGRHGAANGSALLPRLNRHLIDDFLHEQIELWRARSSVRAQQRGIEAVLLGDELYAFALDDRVAAELQCSRGRASEADYILPRQMIEKVADAADNQLDRAIRQQAAVDHHPERRLAQVGGGAGRLHDGWHARQQGGGELFQHAPHGKVEGIDVHRRALKRRVDVLANKAARLA
jgi:hypothetical protein